MQDQVPLVTRSVQPQPHWLELKRQVIAECPVQPQMRIRAPQGRDDLPQHAEHGRLPRPLLLGEGALPFGHDHCDLGWRCDLSRGLRPLLAVISRLLVAGFPHRVGDRRQDDQAAVVERAGGDVPAVGGDLHGRVHVRHVPAAVPAGILHARAEHAAAAAVDKVGNAGQFGRSERLGGAGDRHAAGGCQLDGVHRGPLHVRYGPASGGRNEKRPPSPGGRSDSATDTAYGRRHH